MNATCDPQKTDARVLKPERHLSANEVGTGIGCPVAGTLPKAKPKTRMERRALAKRWGRLPCLLAMVLYAVVGFEGAVAAPVGAVGPNFTIVNYKTGQALNLNDYRDTVILLDFWAYWCGPCRDSAPMVENLNRIYQAQGGNGHGVPVTVISISEDNGNAAAVQDYVNRYGLELVGLDTAGAMNWYGSGGFPSFAVINGTSTFAGHKQWEVLFAGAGYDSQGIQAAIQSVNSPLTITTTSPLPTGSVASPYSQTLHAIGGVIPYTWAVVSNILPSDLSLGDTSGTLAGTVAAAVTTGFRVRVTDSAGAYAEKDFILAFGQDSPVIVTQPANLTANASTTAVISVGVIGSEPFGYRWRKGGVPLTDGGNISGSATATLSVNGLLYGDHGGYDVVVTNPYGTVTSTAAALTVRDPAILVQPVSQNGQAGGSVTFSVTAAGTNVAYHWRKDGVPIDGAIYPTLTFTGIQGSMAGSYDVTVCNDYLCLYSDVALLTINGVETGFNPGVNADNSVFSQAMQPDGKILIGGSFTKLGGQNRTAIARLNADGSLDTAFNPGNDGVVYALAVQPDGKIVVGGSILHMGGQTRQYIARLNPDGTLDTGFNPGSNGTVYSLLLQPDGKILVGGTFTACGGQPRSYLARLNADGTLDDAYNPGASATVLSQALQADGKILIGGSFASAGGQTRSGLARLNPGGTLDNDFNPGTSGGMVYTLAVQTDGKILAGGTFTTLGGQSRAGLGRLNANGSIDSAFSADATGAVWSLALQADGMITVGGAFTSLAGQGRNYLGRLKTDGAPDSSFNPGAGNTVYSLALQPDGKMLVGGAFTTLAGQSRNRIGRLLNTYATTSSLGYDGTTVTWLRGGPAVELWRTTFEHSVDGTTWSPLGAGVRIAGGWQVGGAYLPPGTIRARGYAAGGARSASGSLIESVASLPSVALDSDGDGVPDWWTNCYFGHPAGQSSDHSRASDDASGSGQSNLFKYAAGLDPTHGAAVFRVRIEDMPGQSPLKQLVFGPCLSDRTYTVLSCNNLAVGNWSVPVTSTSTDNGSERTVSNLDTTGGTMFYRVCILYP